MFGVFTQVGDVTAVSAPHSGKLCAHILGTRRSYSAQTRHDLAGRGLKRIRRWILGVGGVLAVGCIDEGFRRCLEFWVVVFPLWCHYLWVDKVSHRKDGPKGGDERDAEFSKLHSRYSPIICRATLYMRGFYLKAAQLVSTRDDFLPEVYLEWCRKLQDEVPMTLSSDEAKKVIAKELKLENLDGILTDWVDEPIGTASIGQVYKARLKSSGEEVAIKVQVPNAERMFRADITCLKMFTYMAIPWAFEQMKEIEKLFQTEFDYVKEFRNLEAMRANLLPSWGHRIYIPRPIPELSTRHVLGMELLKGEKFICAVRRRLKPLADREGKTVEEYEQEQVEALRSGKKKAEEASWLHWKMLMWRWYRRIFRFGSSELEPIDVGGIFEMLMAIHGQQILIDGCFNADPHPGNILLLEDGQTLGLIDFGQVMSLPQDFRLKLARLIVALADRKPEEVARYESEIGVKRKYYKQDVQYRLCSFWLDRDDKDITQGLNIFDLLVWGESQGPYHCLVAVSSAPVFTDATAVGGPRGDRAMSTFAELLEQVNARYEADMAKLLARCHTFEDPDEKVQRPLQAKGITFRRQPTSSQNPSMAHSGTQTSQIIASPSPAKPSNSIRTQKSAMPWATIMPDLLDKPKSQKQNIPLGGAISAAVSCFDLDAMLSRSYMRFVLWWTELKEPTRSGCLYNIIESKPFRAITWLAIVINTAVVTLMTDF
ncbi:unnamed protein product [Cladocopium goreaui]|uniref:AarF domain-containing protein kinase 1 n=1 Tax=Cladocopium goreaui TaxID=2562237 RepID=A0A9P1DRD4_9DINO|nr:unnamed protein product [Cladocopium goreaui]